MPTKKRAGKPTVAAAGDVDVPVTPVHCTNCGYYAGRGVVDGPCPTCGKPLIIAPPS